MAQAKRRRKRKIFSPVYLTLVLIVLYLPILMVVIYSFNSGRTIGSWQGFTTNWYSRLFSNALMADALGQEYGIMVRVGLHCAPNAHKTLDTFPTGTIRFSFGHQNTTRQVDAALLALRKLCGRTTWN